MSELEGWGNRCEKREERGAECRDVGKGGERIVLGWDEKRKESRSRRRNVIRMGAR